MKLLGCLFIVFASVYSSYLYEKSLKNAIKSTTELHDLIVHIRSQIEYFARPINEILKSYYTENEIIQEILQSKQNASLSFLSSQAKESVHSLFSELGKGYKKEQIALCEYNAAILLEYKNDLSANLSKKIKIFRSISLFVGACTIILLI